MADFEQQARFVALDCVQQAPQHGVDSRPQQLASHAPVAGTMPMKDITAISASERPFLVRRIMASSVEFREASILVPSQELVKTDFLHVLAGA
ncbi:MAG: hypothetical protein K2Y37_27265 [Pirellulales bacterium]|nr:hypothetical protein [Pirellulales bacterium]